MSTAPSGRSRRPIAASERAALHQAVAERLRAVQQRYTAGRRALVEALAGAVRHLTVPELAAQRRGLSLSSAYRNLTVLERCGVVRRVVTQDESARFELAEAFAPHHHHLVCEGCGEVLDYAPVPPLERAIAGALEGLPRALAFRPRGYRLEVTGLCAACAAPGRAAVAPRR